MAPRDPAGPVADGSRSLQGITGRDGSFHTTQMIEYGTRVVAGVTLVEGGQSLECVIEG